MRCRALVPTAAVALLLVGCGGDSDATADPTEAAPLPSTSAPATTTAPAEEDGPQLTDRGNIVKALGQDGGQCAVGVDPCTEDKLVMRFAVDAIAVDPECTGAASLPAENGHLIAISLRASTTAALPQDARS